jgi:crotonobetainyl-CoA:carnitine CoA-transferase CaiB-like acyl-CoA transferase
MTSPLAGVRVLDTSQVMAGAIVSRLLADPVMEVTPRALSTPGATSTTLREKSKSGSAGRRLVPSR